MADQYIPTASEIERRIWFRMQGQGVPYTDLSVIAALRIFIREAMVEEFVLLWNGLSRATRAWYLQTATGDELDRRLADFGLSRPTDRNATGEVTFTADASGTTVPRGSVVKTSPDSTDVPVQKYSVVANPDTEDGSWVVPASGTAKVRIQASDVGAAGNTAAGTIDTVESSIAHVASVTNEIAIVNGSNVADEDVRQYFKDWLLSLSGGTRAAVLFKVLNYVDPVDGTYPVHSAALEEWNGTTLLGGNVALKVWIDDGTGQAPSTLVEAIQALLDGSDTQSLPGIRPAGVRALAVSAVPINIPVTVSIDIDRSVAVDVAQRAVESAIQRFLSMIPVSGKMLTGQVQGQVIFSQLFRAVMNVPGVLRASFSTPTTNIALQTGQKAIPGTITVTVLSVS